MEYLAIALLSLGYQVSFEYARLAKLTPFNLAPLVKNSAVSILSMIGGWVCFGLSVYFAVQMWGLLQGLGLALFVFPLTWNILFRITNGGDSLAFWVFLAWVVSPIGAYLLVKM
ncbi:hypothetical protein [Pseudoalteromonas gelatinilytica]